MKKYEVKNHRLDLAKHCFISRGKLNTLLAENYGRNPEWTALKVFDDVEIQDADDFRKCLWGDNPQEGAPRVNTSLYEATQIQNIVQQHGLAPRIFGLETAMVARKRVPLQLTRYINGNYADTDEYAHRIYREVQNIGDTYGFSYDKIDVSKADVVDGKLVDFQTFKFTRSYQETVKDLYIQKAKYGKIYYQNEPLLGLSDGPRDSESRVKNMQLDKIDFKGKNVLDLGCAGGYFCRYARKQGAREVMGVDLDTEAAFHLSNYAGYFNIDYLNHNLLEILNGDYDIVFFLSMNMHLENWLKTVTRAMVANGTAIIEKNGKQSEEDFEKILRDNFVEVEMVGRATDQGNCQKPTYICKILR